MSQKGDKFVIEENTAALAVGNDIREIAVEKDDMFSLTQRQNFYQIADDIITAVITQPDHRTEKSMLFAPVRHIEIAIDALFQSGAVRGFAEVGEQGRTEMSLKIR